MNIFMNIVYAILIGTAGLFLMRAMIPYSQGFVSLVGRLNRLQFLIGILFLSATMYLLNMFIQQLLAAVVILPAYYGIKALAIGGYIILSPFYYTLYVRRLNDISLPGFPMGILLGLYIIFTNFYIPLKNTHMIHMVVIFFIHLGLSLIPGTKRKNAYGVPVQWPPTLGTKS